MKTGIFLNYKGLGANLLHLSYCHQIAKKYGPVSLITLCPNLNKILNSDPLIKEVFYLDKYHKKFFDLFKLAKFLKEFNFENIFIFYPGLRQFLSCKIAGIKNIYHYPLFNKKNLHLVNAAKNFTEKSLKIENCPTETKIFIDQSKIEKYKLSDRKKIILGIGSSGPTTKWGYDNFASLINELNKIGDYYFYLLCGSDEENGAKKIINQIEKKNCESLSLKDVSEIIYYIYLSDIFIGNDSFGHHVACQMNKPSFVILLDTPKAYSDYSKNQYRLTPPNIDINDISHDSALDPNSITTEMILNKIKNFI
jgi:ADP-heptose:LPS heptosyltransferase